MTYPRKTLATEVVLHRPNGVVRYRSVPLTVAAGHRDRYTLTVGSWSDERVELTLTNGERIALIEALGGRA
jgi:hypothetical protein